MSTGLLIVDVQEHYDWQYKDVLVEGIISEADHYDEVSMFWVGGCINDETEAGVLKYWGAFEPPDRFFSNLTLHEKEYGYITSWKGLSQDFLVRTIAYMAKHSLSCSSKIPPEELYRLRMRGCPPGWRVAVPDEHIMIPDWDYDFFRRKSWKTCGGAESDCLWEVETLLQGHGVEISRLPHLTW